MVVERQPLVGPRIDPDALDERVERRPQIVAAHMSPHGADASKRVRVRARRRLSSTTTSPGFSFGTKKQGTPVSRNPL